MPKVRMDDGVEINYRIDDFMDPWIHEKDKDTIFMHHGFARNMKWWIQWVPALSRKYRVLRYDCRGCGESSIPAEGAEWSAKRFIKDVLNLIENLEIQKIHWVGFESGGLLGILFAVTYPDRVHNLILPNTPFKLPDKTRPEAKETYAQGQIDPATAIEKLGLREWLKRSYSNRMDLSKTDPKMLEWHLNEHSKTRTDVAVKIMRFVQVADVSERLSEVKVPTLLMVGDRSSLCPLDQQRFMQQRIPKAKLVVFEGVGQGIHLLMPDRCTEETLKFLATVK
jgi:pimeloyl-ACP methyl ester carboxylesterase